MTKKERERNEAIEDLKKWIKDGDTVYTILRHVSRSGMQRKISVVVISFDEASKGLPCILHPNCSTSKATGLRYGRYCGDGCIVIGGAGMDMGFAVVDEIRRALGYKNLSHEWI